MGFFNLFKRTKDVAPAKQALVAVDGFEAATFSRDRSFILTPGSEAMVNPSEFTRNEITRMSRYLINNYPLAERIASLCEIYGVSAGISANAATQDATFNAAATYTFGAWADSVFCTSDNEMSFYEAQRVMARELLIAGEFFIVLEKAGSGYPQLHLVQSEQVRHSGTAQDSSVDGIYFDASGRALAFNIFTGASFTKVDSSNVIHLKRVKNIGQKRGVGMFASALNAMRDHKDMHILIKKSLKTHLAMAAIVNKKVADAESGIAQGITPIDPSTTLPTSGKTNRGLEKAFGGHVAYMQEGEDVKLLTSEHPTANILAFLELIMRDVCLSVSLPYEFVVNADKLTGTGVRFALSDSAFFFQTLQNLLIDGALNRIYSWVIASFIKLGKLDSPANDVLPWDVTYTRPCSLTVDQGRMSNAEIALLQAGLINREMYFSARGKDWQKEADQLLAETRYMMMKAESLGIPLSLVLPTKQGASAITEESAPAS